MRRAALLLAGATIAFAACGDDGAERRASTTPTVAERTQTTPSPPEPAPARESITVGIPEVAPEPRRRRLGDDDNRAVDDANRAIAEVCDADEPTETQVRDLATAIDGLLDVLAREPEREFVPPARPERSRTMRTAAKEAEEALRLDGCLPEFAGAIDRALQG